MDRAVSVGKTSGTEGGTVNWLLLYLLLLKAVATSFSGMASLPMVREDLVVKHQVLTDRQLSTAVIAGRTGPGPNGLYLVSVGYFIAGLPGALAGLLALLTPAFLILPMLKWAGEYAKIPRVRSAIRAIVLASAGLLLAASVQIATEARGSWLGVAVIGASFAVLTFTDIESWWVMGGAAAVAIAAKAIAG
jgi:chromate transporter